uniref:3-hydroxyanthranilate 3,4-dioxygenase n=1 Tax=Parasteatoda tepidariorum TaxID=114398 RepID=A0A2L2YAP3_PARTP
MLKGDMTLIVYERDHFRNITIKEGEVFMLPAHIPHSPQRKVNTIGLVIERERKTSELDLLRYYVDGSDEILYEKWFYCKSLEELGPLIKEFFESKQFMTGRPIPGTLLEDKPIKQDFGRKLHDPFSLKTWLHSNQDALEKVGKLKLFEGNFVSRIHVLGKGCHSPDPDLPETFLWQIEGSSLIRMASKNYELRYGETILIPADEKYEISAESKCRILSVVMNPFTE